MFKSLKIGSRLTLAFGFICVLLMIVGGYASMEIKSLQQKIDILVKERMVKIDRTGSINDNINLIARGLRNLIIEEKSNQNNELKRISDARKAIGDALEKMNASASTEKEKSLLRKITEARALYIRQTEAYMELVKTDQVDRAKKILLTDVRETQKSYMAAVDELVALVAEDAKQDGKEATEEAGTARTLIAVLLMGALALSVGMTILIVRSITIPVGKASALATIMARGDFTSKLEVRQEDEMGVMAKSLNTMAEQLRGMIRDILGGVGKLTSSSQDLASVSKQLSSSARDTSDRAGMVAAAAEEMTTNIQSVSAAMEESSANVNMVASSTEEMTATVHEIAQSAEKARTISEGAVKQSRQASDKMAALGEAARKIGRVTETITEISDQTNLLALNATIEAARAGEAGKGFAVVANEIKELARQTAEATVDIKNQIGGMQDTTVSTVADIERISEIISEINNVITIIATAVEEQKAAAGEIASNIAQASQGLAEVNENVAQSTVVVADISRDIAGINEQSRQVGDGSNQVQTSAQELADLAAQLDAMVKRFKV